MKVQSGSGTEGVGRFWGWVAAGAASSAFQISFGKVRNEMQLLILWTAGGESAAEERAAADSAALSSSGRAAQGGNRPIPPRAAGLPRTFPYVFRRRLGGGRFGEVFKVRALALVRGHSLLAPALCGRWRAPSFLCLPGRQAAWEGSGRLSGPRTTWGCGRH